MRDRDRRKVRPGGTRRGRCAIDRRFRGKDRPGTKQAIPRPSSSPCCSACAAISSIACDRTAKRSTRRSWIRAGRISWTISIKPRSAIRMSRARPMCPASSKPHLVQGDRFRGAYPKAEAIDEKLLTGTQLDALTDRHRLLRVVQYSDTARIELIHDRLVEVVCRARDERKIREEQVERERQVERHRQAASAAIKRRISGAVIAASPAGAPALALLELYPVGKKPAPGPRWTAQQAAADTPCIQDVAIVGRPTPSAASIFQVELRNRAISRMHLMISHDFYAIDVRSLFGTTVNGEFL